MELLNNVKVLIVEDEVIVALEIKNALNKCGVEVTEMVTNYDDALQSVHTKTPDLIFMDINLENSRDGIETAEVISRSYDIPIVYLSAFSDETTMLRAMATNPINYIIKPFKREDLKSSILLSMYKVKTKDTQETDHGYMPIGHDYYFDADNNQLFYKEQHIRLSTNERKFLRVLIDANNQEVPYEFIVESLWSGRKISQSTFRTLVYRLRAKLEFKLIETVSSYGYRLKK